MPKTAIGLMVAVLVVRSVAALLGVGALPLQTQTQYRIDALACGVLLAYFRTFEREAFDRFAARKWMLLTAVVCGVGLLVWEGRGIFLFTVGWTLTYLTAAAFLLLMYQARLVTNGNVLSRTLAWIGTYSYAMYVFQFVPFRAAEAVWGKLTTVQMPSWLELVVRYAGALMLAIVVTKLLERPMLALRDRWFPATRRTSLVSD